MSRRYSRAPISCRPSHLSEPTGARPCQSAASAPPPRARGRTGSPQMISDCGFRRAGLDCCRPLRLFGTAEGCSSGFPRRGHFVTGQPARAVWRVAHLPPHQSARINEKVAGPQDRPAARTLLLEEGDDRPTNSSSRLITVHAEPVIKGVIRHKLHLNSHGADGRAETDDIYQEVLVQLLAQVRRLRQQPDEHPITDVRGMAAIIAHRTCSRWMRRQFPRRHALKNRLHYLLNTRRADGGGLAD